MKLFKETKNEPGIDLLKIFAMYFVISLHFFLHTGYYSLESVQPDIIFHVSFRALFYECVPLFLLITGYLKRKARFEAEHFIKAIPIIITTFTISGLIIAYKILILKQQFSGWIWAQSVWSFNQPSYGWYINMYLSLILFMPFINAAYDSLKTRKQKLAAVIICVCASTLPVTINRLPHPKELAVIGMPLGYFSGMWPFAYYIVGAYISEFKPKISKFITVPLFLLGCFLLGFANYKTVSTNYYSGFCVENGDIINVIIAALIFLSFYDVKITNKYIRWSLAKISGLSICTFLLSSIFDGIFYPKYAGQFSNYSVFFPTYWKIVPLDFLLSVLLSIPVYLLSNLLSKWIMKLVRKIVNRSSKKKNKNEKGSDIGEAADTIKAAN
ncbi:MAG: acyltransferase family protein [Oscillospiraceae bacterium]|nr:acyltransferase family protein [Oscillospiraceae bacterium]